MILTADEVLALRLSALLLSSEEPTAPPPSVASIVEWFGAMQAQDLASGLWSFGARIPGSTEASVTEALERREALRTWPMRGTIHFVPARDARWMLEVLGARPLAQAEARRSALGFDEATAERGAAALGSALAGGGRLTRAECLEVLRAAGIDTTGQVGYHLLWYASQRGVTCIAPNVGTEQSFALLDEWVPNPHRPERDEALATIALRYFRSHGPATRQDFARWTGLTVADAKAGIAAAGGSLEGVETERGAMIMAAEAEARPTTPPRVLPGFDEYMLGYADRSLAVDGERMASVIPGGNGVFQATLVLRGRVAGVWKRTNTPKRCAVAAWTWAPMATADREGLEQAFARYGEYLGRRVDVRWEVAN